MDCTADGMLGLVTSLGAVIGFLAFRFWPRAKPPAIDIEDAIARPTKEAKHKKDEGLKGAIKEAQKTVQAPPSADTAIAKLNQDGKDWDARQKKRRGS